MVQTLPTSVQDNITTNSPTIDYKLVRISCIQRNICSVSPRFQFCNNGKIPTSMSSSKHLSQNLVATRLNKAQIAIEIVSGHPQIQDYISDSHQIGNASSGPQIQKQPRVCMLATTYKVHPVATRLKTVSGNYHIRETPKWD